MPPDGIPVARTIPTVTVRAAQHEAVKAAEFVRAERILDNGGTKKISFVNFAASW